MQAGTRRRRAAAVSEMWGGVHGADRHLMGRVRYGCMIIYPSTGQTYMHVLANNLATHPAGHPCPDAWRYVEQLRKGIRSKNR
jgi:hypothetical protein